MSRHVAHTMRGLGFLERDAGLRVQKNGRVSDEDASSSACTSELAKQSTSLGSITDADLQVTYPPRKYGLEPKGGSGLGRRLGSKRRLAVLPGLVSGGAAAGLDPASRDGDLYWDVVCACDRSSGRQWSAWSELVYHGLLGVFFVDWKRRKRVR